MLVTRLSTDAGTVRVTAAGEVSRRVPALLTESSPPPEEGGGLGVEEQGGRKGDEGLFSDILVADMVDDPLPGHLPHATATVNTDKRGGGRGLRGEGWGRLLTAVVAARSERGGWCGHGAS
jgi:hypothetical protein